MEALKEVQQYLSYLNQYAKDVRFDELKNNLKSNLNEDSSVQYLEKTSRIYGKYDFVISYTGAPLGKSTINRIVRRHARLANVKEIQPKGLRHSHASLLINELNANPLAVQKRLGYSDIQITLGTYSHLYPTIDREVADNLNGLIKIKTINKSLVVWNGNQHIKKKFSINELIFSVF